MARQLRSRTISPVADADDASPPQDPSNSSSDPPSSDPPAIFTDNESSHSSDTEPDNAPPPPAPPPPLHHRCEWIPPAQWHDAYNLRCRNVSGPIAGHVGGLVRTINRCRQGALISGFNNIHPNGRRICDDCRAVHRVSSSVRLHRHGL